jgi:hypothetical protein
VERRQGAVRLRQPVRSGHDRTRTWVPRQGNNSYIFPGVGLGAIAVRRAAVTDEMFLAAATALAAQVTQQDLAQGSLYPPLAQVRDVSLQLAVAVAEVAFSQGHAGIERPADLGRLRSLVMYDPAYPTYGLRARPDQGLTRSAHVDLAQTTVGTLASLRSQAQDKEHRCCRSGFTDAAARAW